MFVVEVVVSDRTHLLLHLPLRGFWEMECVKVKVWCVHCHLVSLQTGYISKRCVNVAADESMNKTSWWFSFLNVLVCFDLDSAAAFRYHPHLTLWPPSGFYLTAGFTRFMHLTSFSSRFCPSSHHHFLMFLLLCCIQGTNRKCVCCLFWGENWASVVWSKLRVCDRREDVES